MIQLFKKLFPKPVFHKKELLGTSKPGMYTLTEQNPYKLEPTKTDIIIQLFIQNRVRSYSVMNETKHVPNPKLDFWVATGKFDDPTDKDNFVWEVSPREQKKRLLAEIIAEE